MENIIISISNDLIIVTRGNTADKRVRAKTSEIIPNERKLPKYEILYKI